MNPIFLFTFAFLCSQLGIRIIPVASKSTIKIGEEVNSTSLSNLVSDGGNFNLGFITIRETNYNYFGIWYTNDRQQRQVWVANPNNPMTDDSGILTIDTNGQLKIMNRGSTILNISYPQVGTRNTTAKLQDSGNFVLMDEAENTVLWQSFDHPTNTLLPGMKIGANFSTGRNWTLNSWLSDFVPASGAFTLSWEPIQGSGQFVILRRGELYWTRTFEDISPSFFPLYNYSHVRDSNSNYFTLSIQDGNFPMWFLSPKGEIIDIANNNNRITPYDFCYGDEEDNGCVISGLPNCRSQYDKFEEQNANILASASVNDDNSSLSIGDCMQRCWRNCSCIGFASNSNGTGCIIFMGPAEYRVVPADNTQYKYQLTSQRPPKGEKRIWIWIIVAVVLVFMLALSSLCYLRRKRQRPEVKEKKRQEEYLLELTASDSLKNVDEVTIDGSEGHDHDLKLFSFASIKAATNDFSHQNKLGEGGFGPVYKGKLANGREIAVKRLSRTSGQGIVEFKNELILIAKLQHTNLVRMLGCCIYGEEKMLIYEYMPNKSLDTFLFEQSKKELLDWQLRWNIIEGVAQGLLYLHKYSRMRVIHRDLKASNVLLDENMNPKIADFGMARIFKQNETEAVTNRVVGTYGYMSPEYAMEGAFSVKSDVFSFGVLVLEIVSGRRNTSFYHFDRPLNLIGYAWELWKEGVPLELKDPTISGSCAVPQLLRAIHVGLLCVQENATDRPTMSDVVSMLSNETMPSPSPKQPAFFTGRSVIDSITHEGKSKATSVNDLTFTVMEAR